MIIKYISNNNKQEDKKNFISSDISENIIEIDNYSVAKIIELINSLSEKSKRCWKSE